MTPAEPTHCPVCDRRIPADTPLGLCTACLLAAGLAEDKEEVDSIEPPAVAGQAADREPPPGASDLSVRCPQCGHLVQIASGASLSSIHCGSCGTNFSVVDETAASQAAADLGQIGQFQILEKLGTGAFGTVWKARDTRLDRWVSIKIPRHRRLEPAEADKSLREARAAAQLRQPNIVSVHEVGREADLIYIVCDFVEGVSLADWLTGHRMSPREAARLAAKLARALQQALEVLWRCPERYRQWEWGRLVYLDLQGIVSWQAHSNNVVQLAFDPDGQHLLSLDQTGIARVWDWMEERLLFSVGDATNRILAAAFNPTNGQLAVSTADGQVRIWQVVRSGRVPGIAPADPPTPPDVRFSASGD